MIINSVRIHMHNFKNSSITILFSSLLFLPIMGHSRDVYSLNDPELKKQLNLDISNAKTQNQLADAYLDSRIFDRNTVRSYKWRLKAAEQGYLPAQLEVAELYLNGVTDVPEPIYIEAVAKLNSGDTTEQEYEQLDRITEKYKPSLFLAPSTEEALFWLNKAAAQGSAEAYYKIGNIYFDGEHIRKDVPKALTAYQKAAQLNFSNAQLKLAEIYAKGDGVTQSNAEAIKWYTKAAQQGNDQASLALGKAYRSGSLGLEKNKEKAIKWYAKAGVNLEEMELLMKKNIASLFQN